MSAIRMHGLQHKWQNGVRWVLLLIASLYLVFVSVYGAEFKQLPALVQVGATAIMVLVTLVLGSHHELAHALAAKRLLAREVGLLRSDVKSIAEEKDIELAELRAVVVAFIEHSHAYQQKVLPYLSMRGQYLCIAKSSEGFQDVYAALPRPKPQLPFSKVLTEWPNAIRPFENMNVYFIPITGLQGFDPEHPKRWVHDQVIPAVAAARERFVAKLPSRLRRKVDDFSYKYVAFVVRREAIEYDTLNRKFSKEFIRIFVQHQENARLARMTQDLTDFLSTKDFLQIVDWSAFVKLNREQKGLIARHHARLVEKLAQAHLGTLTELAASKDGTLAIVLQEAFGRSYTERKAVNLEAKVLDGTNHVLNVLRKHGVRI